MADMVARSSRYFNSADVADGKVIKGIIDRIEFDTQVGQKGERKDVLFLRGDHRGLVLRPSINKMLSAELGTRNSDEWIGREIELFEVMVQMGAELRAGIRARAVRSK